MDKDEQKQEQKKKEEKEYSFSSGEAQSKAKPPEPRLPVRLMAHKDGSALVEWMDESGMYCRVYVPFGKLDKGTVASKELAKGIPYGLPWEEYIEVTATPEQIANELRRQGVWCWQDINNAALSAANRAFDQGAFLRRVNREVQK
jgi:hypothetical protein